MWREGSVKTTLSTGLRRKEKTMRRENCEGERKDIWKSRSMKCDEKKDGIGRKEKQRRDKNECKKKRIVYAK